MQSLTFVCGFLLFCFVQQSIQVAMFDTNVKSLHVDLNDKYFVNCSYKLIPRRGKGSIIHGIGGVRSPVDNYLINITIYYKYGTIYRPYLIDSTGIDWCKIIAGLNVRLSKSILMQLVVEFIHKNLNQIAGGCPYTGYYEYYVDVNETVSPLMPPIVPEGTYKMVFGAYKTNGDFIMKVVGTGDIKPNFANRANIHFRMGKK